jgi:hypothetical protein
MEDRMQELEDLQGRLEMLGFDIDSREIKRVDAEWKSLFAKYHDIGRKPSNGSYNPEDRYSLQF